MISLDLDPADFPDIAEPHITVVYLGKNLSSAQLDSIGERVKEIAASRPPIQALIGGQGTFAPTTFSDGQIPVIAHVNAPGIDSLHSAFADVDASTFPTYQPHMTQTYVDEGEDIPEPLSQTPVTFTHLSLHKADAVQRYPFGVRIDPSVFDVRSWALFDAMRGKHPRTKKAVKESAHVPEVKAAADEHGWKPTMTKAEADAWVVAMGSKITKPLFHGTDPGSARTILRGGFLKRPALKNAQEYGQGTYLSLNQRYSLRYAHDNDAGLVETRVAVQNPASVAQTREIIKAVDARKPKKADYPALIRAEAEKRGFDALRVQDFFKESMFGSAPEQPVTNLVVFDPKKIVAVSA